MKTRSRPDRDIHFGRSGRIARHRHWPEAFATVCADPDSLRLEYLVDGGAEPVVAVVDQELNGKVSGCPCVGEIAGDLGTLGQVRGSVGHSADQNRSRVQIDKEEHMEGLQLDRFYREEVAGDRCGLVPHELNTTCPASVRGVASGR